MPAAVTLKVADCPAVTLWLAGCCEIDGATGAAVTVSVAALLVTLPVAVGDRHGELRCGYPRQVVAGVV